MILQSIMQESVPELLYRLGGWYGYSAPAVGASRLVSEFDPRLIDFESG